MTRFILAVSSSTPWVLSRRVPFQSCGRIRTSCSMLLGLDASLRATRGWRLTRAGLVTCRLL